MSCCWVVTVFMEPITCLLSHDFGQSRRGAGCRDWRWSRDVLSWPHGSGKRVLPWPDSAAHRHQPGVLERVMSGPSVLGRLGEMLAAGLAKMLRATMTQRIADMPGWPLLRARLICF